MTKLVKPCCWLTIVWKRTMQMKNGKLLLVALVFLAVFFLAPVIPRQVDVLCQGTSSTYMRGTAWQSTGYALLGIGFFIPPPVACIAQSGSVSSGFLGRLLLVSVSVRVLVEG